MGDAAANLCVERSLTHYHGDLRRRLRLGDCRLHSLYPARVNVPHGRQLERHGQPTARLHQPRAMHVSQARTDHAVVHVSYAGTVSFRRARCSPA